MNAVDDLEAVVNLVGGYAVGPHVHETEPEQFERLMRLNVMPAFLLARAAMPRLTERGGGAFVGVSARAALRPFPGAAGYIASKAALLALIQALDAEYKRARHPLQRDRAERDRHSRQPRGRAGRRSLQVGQAGGDRQGRALPRLGGLGADQRRRRARLRARVIGQRRAADLLGGRGVLDRPDRRADQRDVPARVVTRHPLRQVLEQAPVEPVGGP